MFSEYFCFLCHHPTKAAHLSSSQYCSHQPDKGEKPGNLNTKKSTFEHIELEEKRFQRRWWAPAGGWYQYVKCLGPCL